MFKSKEIVPTHYEKFMRPDQDGKEIEVSLLAVELDGQLVPVRELQAARDLLKSLNNRDSGMGYNYTQRKVLLAACGGVV